jgi:hypothetical protein
MEARPESTSTSDLTQNSTIFKSFKQVIRFILFPYKILALSVSESFLICYNGDMSKLFNELCK